MATTTLTVGPLPPSFNNNFRRSGLFLISGTVPTGSIFSGGAIAVSAQVTGSNVGSLSLRVATHSGSTILQNALSTTVQSFSRSLSAQEMRALLSGGYHDKLWQVSLIAPSGAGISVTGFSAIITLTHSTGTINEPTTQTPNANPPPTTTTRPAPTPTAPRTTPRTTPTTPVADIPLTPAIVAQPPDFAAFNTNYTLTIDITKNGVRDASIGGTIVVRIQSFPFDLAAGVAAPLASWSLNGTTATSHFMTVTEGRATGTIQVLSTNAVGRFQVQIPTTGGSISLNSFVYGSTFRISTGGTGGGTPSPGVTTARFTVQPASSANVGDPLSFTVAAVNDSGTTITGYTGKVAIIITYADHKAAPRDTFTASGVTVSGSSDGFIDILEVNMVAGVYAATNVRILRPGRYKFTAAIAGTSGRPADSTFVTVLGVAVPGDIVGLRQNILNDGTLFVGTTGYPTVTANPAISATERTYLDGDFSSANFKAVHGVRLVLPFVIQLEKLETKFKVSSVAANPIIRLLVSEDTTTGTDGTWTLLTSYTPLTTSVTIRNFTFTAPVFAKGIWVTIDQNGGSASCNWYAVHPFGGYVGPTISFLNATALPVDNEGVLSIPYPAEPINTATSKVRDLQIRNNTSTEYVLSLSVEPAREGGDDAVDDEVTIVDTNDAPFPSQFILAPFGSQAFRVRYSRVSAPAALDGDHVVRLTAREAGNEAVSFGVHVGLTIAAVATSFTGTLLYSKSLSNIQTTCPALLAGAGLIHAVGYNTTATNLTRFIVSPLPTGTQTFMDITSPAAESEYTRLHPLTAFTGLVTRNSSGQVYNYDATEADQSEAAWLAATGRIRFTLPATTSGPKTIMPGASGRLWIANGRTSDISIYEVDLNGSIFNTITTATNLSGLTIDCHCYDALSDEVYVITRPSGGVRKIARYDASDGSFIASVTNSHEGGTGNAEGCSVVGQFLYVYYDSRYLNRYDRTTLANNVRMYDNTAPSYADSCWKGYV